MIPGPAAVGHRGADFRLRVADCGLAGTPFAEGLTAVLEQIRRLVPAKALDHFVGLEDMLHVRRLGVTDYSACEDAGRYVGRPTG